MCGGFAITCCGTICVPENGFCGVEKKSWHGNRSLVGGENGIPVDKGLNSQRLFFA